MQQNTCVLGGISVTICATLVLMGVREVCIALDIQMILFVGGMMGVHPVL